ncbi:hypothetical protein [Nitrospira sp. M1]
MNSEESEDIKRYFGVVAEGLRHDIQQVAEGHEIVLTHVKEFRKEVREEFREVRAVIKFSFAELDQRIGTLENEMLRMKKRLDQLEMQKG